MKHRYLFTLFFVLCFQNLVAQPYPVIVELFTSQYCPNCPLAERLISQIGEVHSEDGLVIPLAYHTSYFDYGNNKDRFAEERWVNRHGLYGAVWQTGQLYTPQMTVNGGRGFIGVNQPQASYYIEAAQQEPQAFKLELSPQNISDNQLETQLRVERIFHPEVQRVKIYVAVFENDLETQTPRILWHNDHVVRELLEVTTFWEDSENTFAEEIAIPLKPDWKQENLRVVAFAQDPFDMKIYGAILAKK